MAVLYNKIVMTWHKHPDAVYGLSPNALAKVIYERSISFKADTKAYTTCDFSGYDASNHSDLLDVVDRAIKKYIRDHVTLIGFTDQFHHNFNVYGS